MSNLPLPLVVTWNFVQALKKLGFKDDEISVGAMRTLPGTIEPGKMTNIDPRAVHYAITVVVQRNGASLNIKVSDWPMEPDTVRIAWGAFSNSVATGKISKEAVAKAASKHPIDTKKLTEDCRTRGLIP